jgi:cytochrome c oxidase subunit II
MLAMNVRSMVAAFLLSAAAILPLPLGAGEGNARTISITAQRFSFSPNEITLKKGEEVTLIIQSTDVTHGLVIEDLGVRTEVKKGTSTEVKFTPQAVGTFGGKCAHFCGKGHGSMLMTIHVTE